jgi:protein-disulfide isomerase
MRAVGFGPCQPPVVYVALLFSADITIKRFGPSQFAPPRGFSFHRKTVDQRWDVMQHGQSKDREINRARSLPHGRDFLRIKQSSVHFSNLFGGEQSLAFTSNVLCLLLLVMPLVAQPGGSGQTEMNRRIERQVRAYAEAPPDAQVLIGNRTPSGFTGYDNLPVTIEQKGTSKTFNFLLSKDGKKLLYMKEFDLSEDPYAKVVSKINLSGRPIRGQENAAVTIVVYDDYQCPFCARMYVTLVNEVMNRYRDRVRIVLKDFPIIEAHPWAMRAAIDSNCLAQQNSGAYWEFSDYIHTHQQDVNAKFKAPSGDSASALDILAEETGKKHGTNAATLQACLTQQDRTPVEASMMEGKSLGVSATPTLFVNGQELEGVLSTENLRLVIERALNEAPAK